MSETKSCTVCLQVKPFSEFRKYSGRGVSGLRPLCKICQREYEKGWRSRNPENRRKARVKRKEKAAEYSRDWRSKNRAFYLISGCRRRSLAKGLEFDLDQHLEELSRRVDLGVCEVSGITLENSLVPGRVFNTPSLDRISPLKGYTLDNIRVVAFCVNAMLGDWGESVALEVFKSWQGKTNDSFLQ